MTELSRRSVTFDLIPPDEARQPVRDSVRRYRAACRQLFAVLTLAEAAGARLEDDPEKGPRLTPETPRAKQVLEGAMGQAGKALGYELRGYFFAELYPGALSFVWDSARRDIVAAWRGKDAEFPKASRGWLVLQGARNLAQFWRRGIGFPAATGRPKLSGHTLTLKWDHAIGPVEFGLPRLDGGLDRGRYHVWKNLRDEAEGWALGTLYLGERDGRLFATVTHSRPGRVAEVDPGRVCEIRFGGGVEQFLVIAGPDGAATFDTISAAEAVAWLDRQRARREELERRRAACGNPSRPWGHRHGWLAAQDVLSRATMLRERGQKDRNHAWTRRVVTRAAAWRCGLIRCAFPAEELFGRPWNWTQFEQCLSYKAEEKGIQVVGESQ